MSKKLREISTDIANMSYMIEKTTHLLNYLHEDIEDEIYQPLEQNKISLIRKERVEMMFTLIVTALMELYSVLDMQKEITQSLDEYREGEKEKVPARAATQAEGQRKTN